MSQNGLSVHPNWAQILSDTTGATGGTGHLAIELQCHLVFSLILHLNLSVRDFLFFIFESDIRTVKQCAGTFMGYKSNWATPFSPARLFSAWHERFPRSRKHLHELIIKPCAKEITLDESNTIINDQFFKIALKSCTMEHIFDLLNPGKLAEKYEMVAPFTWDLLTTFTTSPNEYRRRRNKKAAAECGISARSAEDWNEEADDIAFSPQLDSESSAHWRAQGFIRNATFVSGYNLAENIFNQCHSF